MKTDDRIIAILAHLRRDVVGIYTQKKKLKIKAVDVEWRIESFKQGKKNMVDFMIEFEALVMRVDTDKLYTIFLLKKNV